jgi:hypothetical protein
VTMEIVLGGSTLVLTMSSGPWNYKGWGENIM